MRNLRCLEEAAKPLILTCSGCAMSCVIETDDGSVCQRPVGLGFAG